MKISCIFADDSKTDIILQLLSMFCNNSLIELSPLGETVTLNSVFDISFFFNSSKPVHKAFVKVIMFPIKWMSYVFLLKRLLTSLMGPSIIVSD